VSLSRVLVVEVVEVVKPVFVLSRERRGVDIFGGDVVVVMGTGGCCRVQS
jgi:hypothetical protein